MTAQDQQSREAFEQSAQEIWPEMNIVRGHYGGYLDFNTHDKWLMWKAARALPAGMEPEIWLFADRTWTEIKAMAVDHDGIPVFSEDQVLAMGHVPPGWQAVPVEPTQEMLAGDARKVAFPGALKAAWVRMLAAAPRPPVKHEFDEPMCDRWPRCGCPHQYECIAEQGEKP